MLYDATIVSVDYKAKGRAPGNDSPTRLPLVVCVYFHAGVRGLPGFDTPICEYFDVDSLEDLREKSQATIAELERKGDLYLRLKKTLESKQPNLADIMRDAKPAAAHDLHSVTAQAKQD